MKKYGYIRVSTKDQNPERQFIALQEYGIPKENIYLDQMSGRDFLRPQYQRLMKALRKGDLLVVKELHRKLWFDTNRGSEWELCALRYDDLYDRLRMFARNCRNRKMFNIHV